MAKNYVKLETTGIKRALKGVKPYEAIAEYVWNGFDAEATQISLTLQRNELGSVSAIRIDDNGYGINKDSLAIKFHPAFESNKVSSIGTDRKNSSIIHGRNGVGRFTFFVLAQHAIWTTVYEKDKKRYKYSIDINASFLNEYDDSDEYETIEPCGTSVALLNFDAKIFDETELVDYLRLEFAWYLELNKAQGYLILINGSPLDYMKLLEEREDCIYKYEREQADKIVRIDYNVTYCKWTEKLNEEYSKYY